jgi:hypothetical protein
MGLDRLETRNVKSVSCLGTAPLMTISIVSGGVKNQKRDLLRADLRHIRRLAGEAVGTPEVGFSRPGLATNFSWWCWAIGPRIHQPA